MGCDVTTGRRGAATDVRGRGEILVFVVRIVCGDVANLCVGSEL